MAMSKRKAVSGTSGRPPQKAASHSDTKSMATHPDAHYKGSDPIGSEGQMNKTAKPSKTVRANKRKAKLKAKHRRQRARATA